LLARLALVVLVAQLFEEVVLGFGGTAKHLCRLGQASADAVRQLAGGRTGEGHHQHVLRQQWPHGRSQIAAMAQHQAHIQRSNRPGLARTGTRLDQVAATQRKAVRMQGMGTHATS